MTLDDLIEQLLTLRRDYPAAGSATVIGFDLDVPVYKRGEVWFGDFDPDYSDVIEVKVTAPPTTGDQVH